MAETLTTGTIIKHCAYLFAGVAGIITHVGIEPKAIFILSIFMVLDVVTGVSKTIVINGLKSYRSMKLSAGVLAKCFVILVPFVVALTGHRVGADLTFIASAAVSILIFSEASSILGNIHAIHKRQETGELDAVAIIIGIFRGFVERYFESIKNMKK